MTWFYGGFPSVANVICGVGLVLMWSGVLYAIYILMRRGIGNGELDCIPEKLAEAVTR